MTAVVDGEYLLPNGGRISLSESGSGIPLICIHGFPLDRTMWKSQIAGLAHRCRMIAPDLRGFGRSSNPPADNSMQSMADDVAQLLEQMSIQRGVFCGLSMGGYVAWQFVKRHRDLLAGLVVCDSRVVADSDEAARNRRTLAERVRNEGAKILVDSMLPRLFSKESIEQSIPAVQDVVSVIQNGSPAGFAGALEAMAVRPDMTNLLGTINVPTLVICGEHDMISPLHEMREIARQIPGSEFVAMPGAGHMAPLENAPAVNAALDRFLSRV